MKSLPILLTTALLSITACQSHQNQPNHHQDSPARTLLNNAISAYQQHNYPAALPLLEQAKQMGDMKASRYLGYMYLHGTGVQQNTTRAFNEFQTAAERGDITGQYWLAYCYENGIGTNKDVSQALHWYQISAQRGDKIAAPAMSALGRFYLNGIGVKANRAQAIAWYQKAANVGDEEAQTALKSIQ